MKDTNLYRATGFDPFLVVVIKENKNSHLLSLMSIINRLLRMQHHQDSHIQKVSGDGSILLAGAQLVNLDDTASANHDCFAGLTGFSDPYDRKVQQTIVTGKIRGDQKVDRFGNLLISAYFLLHKHFEIQFKLDGLVTGKNPCCSFSPIGIAL